MYIPFQNLPVAQSPAMTLITLRTAIYVGVTSVGAVLLVSMTACSAILLTLFLKAVLAAILQAIATVGEIGIATVAAIASGISHNILCIANSITYIFYFVHDISALSFMWLHL